jgi:hypothetical protein
MKLIELTKQLQSICEEGYANSDIVLTLINRQDNVINYEPDHYCARGVDEEGNIHISLISK